MGVDFTTCCYHRIPGDAGDPIAEEIDSRGRSEKRELISRLTILLLHVLKEQYQPERARHQLGGDHLHPAR